MTELQNELGGRDTTYLAKLSDGQAEHLLTDLRAAKQQERNDLQAAIEQALGFVPALLRGPVKRALFPKR